METRAFFVGKPDDFNCKRKTDVAIVKMLHRGNGDKHAERAIEFPGVTNGIQMGAKQENFGIRPSCRIMTDQIADGVVAGGHSRLLHPKGDLLVGASHGR